MGVGWQVSPLCQIAYFDWARMPGHVAERGESGMADILQDATGSRTTIIDGPMRFTHPSKADILAWRAGIAQKYGTSSTTSWRGTRTARFRRATTLAPPRTYSSITSPPCWTSAAPRTPAASRARQCRTRPCSAQCSRRLANAGSPGASRSSCWARTTGCRTSATSSSRSRTGAGRPRAMARPFGCRAKLTRCAPGSRKLIPPPPERPCGTQSQGATFSRRPGRPARWCPACARPRSRTTFPLWTTG